MSSDTKTPMSPTVKASMKRFMKARKEMQRKDGLRQLRLGFCDRITPSSKPGAIKVELTADKNRVFVVNSFRGKHRVFHRRVVNHFQETVTQSVFVGKTPKSDKSYGVLKQKHQEAMYELFHLWVEGGHRLISVNRQPRAFIVTTANRLAKAICNNTGGRSYDYVRNVLRDLSSIPIYIRNAYTNNGLSTLEFSLLGEVTWCTHRGGSSEVYIQFSPPITKGLLNGYVKDFSFDTYKGVGRSGPGPCKAAAMMLYNLLDMELSHKKAAYNISFTHLSHMLGLCAYDHKSQRREKIAPLIEAVNGKEICGGQYRVRVILYLSKSLNDYVLEAYRTIEEALRSMLSIKLETAQSCSIPLTVLLRDLGLPADACKDRRKEEIDPAIQFVHGKKAAHATDCLQLAYRFDEELDDYVLEAYKVLCDSRGQRMIV